MRVRERRRIREMSKKLKKFAKVGDEFVSQTEAPLIETLVNTSFRLEVDTRTWPMYSAVAIVNAVVMLDAMFVQDDDDVPIRQVLADLLNSEFALNRAEEAKQRIAEARVPSTH
jgi:hypothetical protein